MPLKIVRTSVGYASLTLMAVPIGNLNDGGVGGVICDCVGERFFLSLALWPLHC